MARYKWLSSAISFACLAGAADSQPASAQIAVPSPAIAVAIENRTAPNQHLTAIALPQLDPRLWPDISKQQIVREAAVAIRPMPNQFRTVANEIAQILTGPALSLMPQPDMSRRQIVTQGAAFVPPPPPR